VMLASLVPLLAAVTTPAVDPRYTRLLSWLTENGANVGPVVLGRSTIGAGGGAFLTQAVDEGDLLFSLPTSVCIGLPQVLADDDVGEALGKLCARGQGGATVALASFVTKEWLCSGDQGRFGPLLAMLPWDAAWPPEGEQEQEHVLWWSEKQVDALYGSEVSHHHDVFDPHTHCKRNVSAPRLAVHRRTMTQ
jgi:hypothetical protein